MNKRLSRSTDTGTLRAAKKRKIVSFEGEMLLSPAHDDVDIVLCKET